MLRLATVLSLILLGAVFADESDRAVDPINLAGSGGTAGSNMFDFGWRWDLPLYYGTTYYATVGPYDSDEIWQGIDENQHFEEVGIEGEVEFSAGASIGLIGDAPG